MDTYTCSVWLPIYMDIIDIRSTIVAFSNIYKADSQIVRYHLSKIVCSLLWYGYIHNVVWVRKYYGIATYILWYGYEHIVGMPSLLGDPYILYHLSWLSNIFWNFFSKYAYFFLTVWSTMKWHSQVVPYYRIFFLVLKKWIKKGFLLI